MVTEREGYVAKAQLNGGNGWGWGDVGHVEATYRLAAVEAMPVSASARQTLVALEQAPLVSAQELSAMCGRSVSVVHRGLNELLDARIVERRESGASRSKRYRWHIRDECIRMVGPGFGLWHDEWALCRLFDRMPVVESVYESVGVLGGLGRLKVFQWFGGAVWDAAALFEEGWVLFLWAGLWQDERRLRAVMGKMGVDLVRLAAFGESAWPAAVCFVVHDAWERELVFRAARREGLLGSVAVWCMSDRQWSGETDAGRCRGWVAEYVFAREFALGMWERRLEESVWNSVCGDLAWRGLMAIAEWDRISCPGIRNMVGEGKNGRRVFMLLRDLVRMGLVTRSWDGVRYRYSGSAKLHGLMAGLDRMRRTALPSGYGRSTGAEERGLQKHEDGVLGVMSGFMAAGLPTASGWRSWEHLGGGGGIAPDGMVYLEASPYGSGWHYVEYELRASGKVRIARKLRGYVAGGRQDDWPVLFVVTGETAERNWHVVGGALGARMVTATTGRLRRGGVVGSEGVWSLYGEYVVVG